MMVFYGRFQVSLKFDISSKLLYLRQLDKFGMWLHEVIT